MDAGSFLFSMLVVVVASRIAAEVSDRVGVPGVLLEILAGIVIGPSLLSLVQTDSVELLAELGVVLLLFEVGIQMNLKDLLRVGGDSLRVAFIGVALPMAGGFLVLDALGVERHIALFIAGGITATSVGITARVFGDLRALASPEARIVLGAAVADDVAGLLILALVSGMARNQNLGPVQVASTVGAALGFLVAASLLGSWLLPRLVSRARRRSRAEGTLAAAGIAAALALAGAASLAGLAPLVGAFVAGVALSGSEHRDELHRRLAPIGQLLIPIFFLQIGVKTQLQAIVEPGVLLMAALLSAVAVAGKLSSGFGVRRGVADRLLVGVAMVPRGEVGLIFAGLGLGLGILPDRFYGTLVLVVLVTTVLAPPWLRWRLRRSRELISAGGTAAEPPGGWLRVMDGEVELAEEPVDLLAPRIGLDAAIACAHLRPGPNLTRWITANAAAPVTWDANLRARLFALLEGGNERSWRFLENTGLLSALLPSLDEAIRKRARDPFDLDRSPAWESLSRLADVLQASNVAAPERLELIRLAAVIQSAFEGEPDPASSARELARFIGGDEESVDFVGFLVGEANLLTAAASRPDATVENSILELADHIESQERARALYLLTVAANGRDALEREKLQEVYGLIADSLKHSEVAGSSARGVVEKRKEEVRRGVAHVPLSVIERFLDAAPRRYFLAHDTETIRRHLSMVETPLARDEIRIRANPGPAEAECSVDIVFSDRPGALAAIASAFASLGIPVTRGIVSTLANGIALDVFYIEGPPTIDWEEVRDRIRIEFSSAPNAPQQPIGGIVDIDNSASPWYTIVEIRAHDRTDLLEKVASAITFVGAQIHEANVRSEAGVAVDTFYVTGRRGGKLDSQSERKLREALSGNASRRRPMVSFSRR